MTDYKKVFQTDQHHCSSFIEKDLIDNFKENSRSFTLSDAKEKTERRFPILKSIITNYQ